MKILQYLAVENKINPNEINIPTPDANEVLANVLGIAYAVIGAVAVIVIIIAGYMYVTSHGDPASVTKAKSAILNAVIGLIVVLAAFAVTWFVMGRF